MAILESILLADPFADKLSAIQQDSMVIETNAEEAIFDINKIYQYSRSTDFIKSDLLKEKILQYHYTLEDNAKISLNVINNAFALVDNLYPSILNELDIHNVTSTPYGTIVIDWEKDIDNVFSLEIGDREIGYFIEVNGKDSKQLGGTPLNSCAEELLSDISNFLS